MKSSTQEQGFFFWGSAGVVLGWSPDHPPYPPGPGLQTAPKGIVGFPRGGGFSFCLALVAVVTVRESHCVARRFCSSSILLVTHPDEYGSGVHRCAAHRVSFPSLGGLLPIKCGTPFPRNLVWGVPTVQTSSGPRFRRAPARTHKCQYRPVSISRKVSI